RGFHQPPRCRPNLWCRRASFRDLKARFYLDRHCTVKRPVAEAAQTPISRRPQGLLPCGSSPTRLVFTVHIEQIAKPDEEFRLTFGCFWRLSKVNSRTILRPQ